MTRPFEYSAKAVVVGVTRQPDSQAVPPPDAVVPAGAERAREPEWVPARSADVLPLPPITVVWLHVTPEDVLGEVTVFDAVLLLCVVPEPVTAEPLGEDVVIPDDAVPDCAVSDEVMPEAVVFDDVVGDCVIPLPLRARLPEVPVLPVVGIVEMLPEVPAVVDASTAALFRYCASPRSPMCDRAAEQFASISTPVQFCEPVVAP